MRSIRGPLSHSPQSTRIIGAVEALLDPALRRVGHEGEVARGLERHRPPLLAARRGIRRHHLAHELRKLRYLLRVGYVHRKGIRRIQRVAAEAERRGRELLGILSVKCLILVREGRARTDETLICLLQKTYVRLREPLARALPHRLHTGEKPRVEPYVVAQGRQRGLHAFGNLLHLVRGVGLAQVEKEARDALQKRTLTLQRRNRILKGRGRRIRRYGRNIGTRGRDGSLEGRKVIPDAYTRKGRRRMGRMPLLKKGIAPLRTLCHIIVVVAIHILFILFVTPLGLILCRKAQSRQRVGLAQACQRVGRTRLGTLAA